MRISDWSSDVCSSDLDVLISRATHPMLINNWYVASEASEVVMGSPRKVRMLGFDFVLFRDGTGRVACLSDVCIHRGASLSKGRCEGAWVACPFHGGEVTGEGRCQQIPALGDRKGVVE